MSEGLEPKGWMYEATVYDSDGKRKGWSLTRDRHPEWTESEEYPLFTAGQFLNMVKAVSDDPEMSNADVIDYVVNELEQIAEKSGEDDG